jgi:hypothetical protein
MGILQPAPLEANPDGAIEPAGKRGQIVEKGFAEKETLTLGSHGTKPHFPTLVAAVEDRSPMEASRPVVIPIQDPEELFSECVNYKR